MVNTRRQGQDRSVVIFLIAGFLLSRVVFRSLLALDPSTAVLEGHWQHADLAWLHDNLRETLLYLHSQPPAWNGIIGLLTKLVGTDPADVAEAITFLFALMSLGMMLGVFVLARRTGLPRAAAALIALLISISPSMIYYELYPFYPHLTAFLMLCIMLAATYLDTHGYPALLFLCGCLLALSWTWSVFHPVFVVLTGLVCIAMYSAARTPLGLATLAVTMALSFGPTLKNNIVFGRDFASSWVGINLTQTLPNIDQETRVFCSFETIADILVSEEVGALSGIGPVGIVSVDAPIKPSSGYPNMNNPLVSERAAECFEIYMATVGEAPSAVLGYLVERLATSHAAPPYIYEFRPDGWEATAWPDRIYHDLGMGSKILSVAYYAVLILYGLLCIRFSRDPKLVLLALSIIAYFTLITHVANGNEQNRMRLTIEPLYYVLLIGLLGDIYRWFSSREP